MTDTKAPDRAMTEGEYINTTNLAICRAAKRVLEYSAHEKLEGVRRLLAKIELELMEEPNPTGPDEATP